MIVELLVLFIMFILPVILCRYKIIGFNYRFLVLLMLSLLAAAFSIFYGWSLMTLGITFNNLSIDLVPYILITAVASMALIFIYKKHLKPLPIIFSTLFMILLISFLQEFVYRGFMMPVLGLLTKNYFLIILINVLLFWLVHTIYINDLKSHIIILAGGLIFAIMYILYPNLILISISHAVLNAIAVYSCGLYKKEFRA
jgi:membrane protease YdiL (CAAX protease family)